jgi:OmpA-OmpF porin, OOP family
LNIILKLFRMNYFKILILTLVIAIVSNLNGQTLTDPMAVSFKSLFMDYQSQNGGSISALKDYQYGFELGFHKSLSSNINLNVPLKFGVVRSHDQEIRPIQKTLYGLDAQIQYNFTNNQSDLNPYILAGAGGVMEVDGDFNAQIPFGAGLNFRVADNAFINVQSEFRFAMKEGRHNLHHGIGFVYSFGGKKDQEEIPVKIQDKESEWVDSDGDGVPDHLDLCPDEAGPAHLDGCPDRDGDGVPDYKDECPDVPGLAQFKGCPDTDGDGIPDHLDDCPNVAGPASNKGCPEDTMPDRDGDGIPDHLDACPDVAGLAEFDGCPDTDGDGIPDHLDACPTKPGPAIYGGCPDTDGDGIPDHLDDCPEIAGPVSNRGCPEIAKEDKETLTVAMRSVQFQTGKAVLKTESFAILNQIANLVRKYPNFNLAISGHTDNVGSPVLNQGLSERRAKACYDYLVQQGIPAARMSHVGFGDSRPISNNNNETGRALNRRVEFQLIPR